MSPSANNSHTLQHAHACVAAETDTTILNVIADSFVLDEETRSVPVSPEAQASAICGFDASSERMNRLEGLLVGMAQQQDQFMKTS